DSPRDIYVLFEAGRCIGLIQGLAYAPQLVGVCPPAEVTYAQRARVAVTYIEARPERVHEDFRVLAVQARKIAWPCKGWKGRASHHPKPRHGPLCAVPADVRETKKAPGVPGLQEG